jgi:pSer/pThr/pTyr-binding forkhead associated (FHA) protein
MSSSAHARQPAVQETPFATPHVFVLAAIDGASHEVHRLVRTETTVGRRPDAHVVVNDEDVVAQHCKIRCDAGQCHIIDTGSPNGTLVNSRRLVPGVAHRLRHLDEVQLGATRFLFLTGRFIDRSAKR